MKRRSRALVIRIATVQAGLVTVLSGLPLIEGADFVCGPRCVQYLVRHYRPDDRTELIDFVRELQWPNLEAGTDLAHLAESLQSRGIHTSALTLGHEDELVWPQPVLLHLRAANDTELGHFVIWLPTSTLAKTEVWAGISGAQRGPWSLLHKRMSGHVLLTSADAINDSSSAIRRRNGKKWLAVACTAGGILLFARSRYSGRLFDRKAPTTHSF